MDFLQYVAAFIGALGVLIAVHEYGHFWVARRCGVRVIKFSIGFGKTLYSRKDKQGTEFAISAIPFGGYVKMVGEPGTEGEEIDPAESFAHKTVWQRIAIVAAGPLVNLVFAVLLYWLIFIAGVTRVAPVVGDVFPGGVADRAGITSQSEIVSVDGRETLSWSNVNFALVSRLGDDGFIEIETKRTADSARQTHRVDVSRWMIGLEKEGPLVALGVDVFRPLLPVLIGEVMPGKAAERGGVQAGDKIVSANGVALPNWFTWARMIRQAPLVPMELEVVRNGDILALTVLPESIVEDGKAAVGRLGVMPDPTSVTYKIPDEMIRHIQYGPVEAVGEALLKTKDFISLTLAAMGKMIKGQISLDNLSGPITIAKVAGDTASYGLEPFLSFVAYLSISLGVLNLLPVPMLDGGHLMYYLVEMVKGSPVSETLQDIGNRIGLAMLLAFMGVAFYNDIAGL
ncbi:RIP metalloprotease RseP [Gammaproteobacteria bacterium 45_16_T64]|nr:RIP metalloprotease RseP [Gammaproteobacteria bacterium 45_16_T64]